MWLTKQELKEEVNLDEGSTGGTSYGAKFDQYCTVSGLTQLNLLASESSKGMDHGPLNHDPLNEAWA